MVTFTFPEELRWLARSHQKAIYSILFRASADALLELASDPRFVGGKIGMVGVLHTGTRDLFYQHVLPDHFVKVRYYGLLSSSHRHWLDHARQLLTPTAQSDSSQADPEPKETLDPPRCPKSGSILKLIERLKPRTRWPP
jgi:hypothetical protein